MTVLLQIFNSRLVLASPETATDADYAAIEGVIGHEVCCPVQLLGCECVTKKARYLFFSFHAF